MKGIRRSFNKDKIGSPRPNNVQHNQALNLVSLSAAQQQQQLARQLSFGASSSNNPGAGSSASAAAGATAAPQPPKKVIRALQSFRAQSHDQLSFDKGDFFHVVAEDDGDGEPDDDTDVWFVASNPMTGARGRVPASHFQVLGRNERETKQQQHKKLSTGASSLASLGAGTAPAALAQQSQHPPNSAGSSSGASSMIPLSGGSAQASGSRLSQAEAGLPPKFQPLYGVVQYDFVAERPDELDAKRGEPIIVIAQSNHEWFVAKPIGRLGGPGLIPVAFIEIQDKRTGRPVDNVDDLIRAVPRVEEWKKMTAEYKSASIPLGRFDFGPMVTPPTEAPSSNGGHERLPSLSSVAQQHAGGRQISSHYDTSADERLAAPGYAPAHMSHSSPALGQSTSAAGAAYDGHPGPLGGGEDEGLDDQRYSYTAERDQYGLILSAVVVSFHEEDGSFWFHLHVACSTGISLVLYRLYADFFDFHMALMDEFPVEAGREPPSGSDTPERVLPMMPGPTEYEDELTCANRVRDLSIYLANLTRLPDYIRTHGLFYEFFALRPGDVEQPQAAAPLSSASQQHQRAPSRSHSRGPSTDAHADTHYSEVVDYLNQMNNNGAPRAQGALPPGAAPSANSPDGAELSSSMSGMQINGNPSSQPSEFRPSSVRQEMQRHQSSSSSLRNQQSFSDRTSSSFPYSSRRSAELARLRNHTGRGAYATPNDGAAPAPAAPPSNAQQNVPYIKIKIFHRNTDGALRGLRVLRHLSR